MVMDNVQVLSADPLVLIIDLPDGCSPGKWEAAESFAESFAGIVVKYPGKNFQFIPFSYDDCGGQDNPALKAVLAVSLS